MGIITDLSRGVSFGPSTKAQGLAREAVERGRSLWRQSFGQSKEEALTQFPRVRDRQSWTRGVVSEPAAYKRLLQAMRSMAPGGWSDDRWEQSQHLNGIVYTAIFRKMEQYSISDFQVFKKDPRISGGKRPITPSDPPEGGRPQPPYDLVRLLENPNNDDSWGDLCFPLGTRVRMADGSQKPIEKVQLNDEVVTAEGNVNKIRDCYVRSYKGDLVQIVLWGHSHLKCTPNHPILTKRGYIPSGELQKGDWVAIPRYAVKDRIGVIQTALYVNQNQKHAVASRDRRFNKPERMEYCTEGGTLWANYKKLPDFIKLTPGFGRILGLFLAEGCSAKGYVQWTFNADERFTLVEDLLRLLKEELGVDARVQSREKRNTVVDVVLIGKLWSSLFRSLCGYKCYGKRIHPDLMSGPDDFLESMYEGWKDGDGCSRGDGQTWVITVSRELALGMFDVLVHLGKRPAIRLDKRTGEKFKPEKVLGVEIKSRLDIWVITVAPPSDNYRVHQEDKVMWRRVRELRKSFYEGDVYNLGVDKDHSYIAEGVGVHNCSWQCQQMDLTGMALTWMVPNKLGIPHELYVIPTSIAIPQPAINPDYPDGYYRIQPIYPYGPFSSYPTPATAVGAPIPAQWMLRFKYPHPILRYDGYSPLTAMRLHVDEVEAMDRSRWYTMNRLINPSAILNFKDMEGMEPLPEAEIERIRSTFEASFQGPEDSGRLFVSAPGSELSIQNAGLRELEFRDGWNQLVEFIHGAGFGISKTAAGMVESSTYSVLFATLKQLHLLTIDPQCKRIGRYLTKHLAPFFGDDLVVEVRAPRIDDHDVKNAVLQLLTNAKAITKNEMRKELNIPLSQEQWGDEIAGTESQQGQMPGMPGPPGMGGPGEGPPQALAASGMPPPADRVFPQAPKIGPSERSSVMPEPPAIASGRPRPGKLSRHGQGPRKGLEDSDHKESRYERYRKVIANGHH